MYVYIFLINVPMFNVHYQIALPPFLRSGLISTVKLLKIMQKKFKWIKVIELNTFCIQMISTRWQVKCNYTIVKKV